MKHPILAAAFALLSTAAFAGANYSLEGKSATDTNGDGNMVSTYSSSGTGNGAVVGGNGTSHDNSNYDGTSSPGSRARDVHSLGVGAASAGRGYEGGNAYTGSGR